MVDLNPFEKALSRLLGGEKLKKIQGVKVGIAGAGGLGSNCAQFLVRSGFKRFCIVDFDTVEEGNLNRQFFFSVQVGRKKVDALKENLLSINPDLEIEALHKKIEEENLKFLFNDCHAVVEALDSAVCKRMLVEHFMGTGKLLVAASGLAGWGKSDDIRIHRIRENFFLVGDLVSGVGPDRPPMAPMVVTAAAKQADIVLGYFLANPDGGVSDGD
ncbi:MAG: sulfur carrier protein ThiS adenylyltransferase ThiF [Bacillota bacterium]